MGENEEKEIEILDIPDTTKYWFVRANTAAEYLVDFYNNNYIATDSSNQRLIDFITIPSNIRSSNDALKTTYKAMFNDRDIASYENDIHNKRKTNQERAEDLEQIRRRSTSRANTTFKFVELMNIGDFIFVPFKSSEKFLVGIVTSDVFDGSIRHVQLLDNQGNNTYHISPYKFKRRVVWIKKIMRSQFPEKLSWIRNAHQSLFDITEQGADVLNPVIAPIYRYRGKVYCRIGVNTDNQISNSTWLTYQLTLQNILGKENNDRVFQKSRVQSKGDLIQFAADNWWWLIILIWQGLFGEIDFNIIFLKGTFHGPLKKFLPSEKKKAEEDKQERDLSNQHKQADIDKIQSETEKNNAETRKLNLDIEQKKTEIAKSREIAEQVKGEITNVMSRLPEDSRNNPSIKSAVTTRMQRNSERFAANNHETVKERDNIKVVKVDADKIRRNMKLSNESVGTPVELQKQIDRLKSLPDNDTHKAQ
ncbi:hypothetical protein QUF07_07505 [Lentilactobacillus sp. TOM.63]|uniref:hypothetical protein n=1 Tax=Lentilactobacillus sp. TOM.63 TaxID=3055077 RepID=UPI0025A0E9D2|nr:hypothetical protein [Lentilactobacillus sp. TOM.63]MDM7516559.1 hypothetical protein [Lentilactobacillus sp. TOM.63]